MQPKLLLPLLALLFMACNKPLNRLASKKQDKLSDSVRTADFTIQLTLDDEENAKNIRKAMAGKMSDSLIEVAIQKISALLPKDRSQ